jgi:hypothetical protein
MFSIYHVLGKNKTFLEKLPPGAGVPPLCRALTSVWRPSPRPSPTVDSPVKPGHDAEPPDETKFRLAATNLIPFGKRVQARMTRRFLFSSFLPTSCAVRWRPPEERLTAGRVSTTDFTDLTDLRSVIEAVVRAVCVVSGLFSSPPYNPVPVAVMVSSVLPMSAPAALLVAPTLQPVDAAPNFAVPPLLYSAAPSGAVFFVNPSLSPLPCILPPFMVKVQLSLTYTPPP